MYYFLTFLLTNESLKKTVIYANFEFEQVVAEWFKDDGLQILSSSNIYLTIP